MVQVIIARNYLDGPKIIPQEFSAACSSFDPRSNSPLQTISWERPAIDRHITDN